MSPESDLRTVAQALLDLTSEVTLLHSRVVAVEKRVTKLEQASFTPTGSPALSPQTTAHGEGDLASAPPASRAQAIATDEGDISSTLVSQEENLFCDDKTSRNLGLEIQRRVQPLEATLCGITGQLSRIENAISNLAPTAASPATQSSTLTYQDCHSSPEQPSDKNSFASPPEPHTTKSIRTPKLRPNPAVQPQVPHPVFGCTSTPRTRVVSPAVSLNGSPFGFYSNEKSPFAQLVKKEGARSAFDTLHLMSKDPFKQSSRVKQSLRHPI